LLGGCGDTAILPTTAPWLELILHKGINAVLPNNQNIWFDVGPSVFPTAVLKAPVKCDLQIIVANEQDFVLRFSRSQMLTQIPVKGFCSYLGEYRVQ
jgi:hypothetical protein